MKRVSFKKWRDHNPVGVGDVVVSSIWKNPRKVRAMDAFTVTLTEILEDGRHHNMAIVKSLPADTHIVKEDV